LQGKRLHPRRPFHLHSGVLLHCLRFAKSRHFGVDPGLGAIVGLFDGREVGIILGREVGITLGREVGIILGRGVVGELVGYSVGEDVEESVKGITRSVILAFIAAGLQGLDPQAGAPFADLLRFGEKPWQTSPFTVNLYPYPALVRSIMTEDTLPSICIGSLHFLLNLIKPPYTVNISSRDFGRISTCKMGRFSVPK